MPDRFDGFGCAKAGGADGPLRYLARRRGATFFSPKPICRRTVQSRDRLTGSRSSVLKRCCISANVKSDWVATSQRRCCCTSGVILLRGPRGPDGGRSIRPVLPNSAEIFFAQPTLTQKRSANSSRLSSPC